MDSSVKTQADLRKRIVHGWNTDTPPVYVGGALRHPAYKGLRTDKSINDVKAPIFETGAQ